MSTAIHHPGIHNHKDPPKAYLLQYLQLYQSDLYPLNIHLHYSYHNHFHLHSEELVSWYKY